jgi:signal transduction histidine kinase/ActR/RegA family two-component response regulator
MRTPSIHEAAFNSSPVGNCLLSPTVEMRVLSVNDAFLRAVGRGREDLVGTSLYDVLSGDMQETELAAMRRSLERVLATGQADTLPPWRHVTRVHASGGAADHEERFRIAANTPVFGDDGQLLCISHTLTDVTEKMRTEAVMRDSEARYRALSNASADVIYRMSPDWSQMRQMEGRGFLEDVPHPKATWLDEFIPPEERERVNDAVAAAIRGKSVFELEHRVRRIDGSQGWTLSRAVPMLGADGEIREWIGAATDITQRRQAQAKYRTLFDSIDEGFCVIEVLFDAGGVPCDYLFCEVNPAFEAHTGLRDVAGKTIRALNPHHEQHWFDIYGEVQRTGLPRRFEDGSESLDRYFDVYAFRIEDEGVPRVAVLFKDISSQKRAYRQAGDSERRAVAAAARAEEAHRSLEALLQAAPVGIVMSNPDGGVVLANAEHRRLWGGQPPVPARIGDFAEWKGWWADGSERQGTRLAPDEWPTARVLRGEDVRHATVEIESFAVPPARHTLLISAAPVKNDAGAITGAALVEMDITDRVRAEQALRAADRRKDEFLAMLAHELRNPLAPISAAADLLATASLDRAKVMQTSAVISRQVRHMAGLVEDLLDVSRVTRGLVKIGAARLDARQIIADAVEQVRPLIEARRHRMAVHVPPDEAPVSGDRNRLIQVMANLLGNAARYTPEGGTISITAEAADGTVTMHVTDNGIGMEPELIAHAFDLFTQARRTSDRSQGGLGIGLALVKSLVELHGGHVAAYSEGAGRGSTLTVTLPRAYGGADAAADDAVPPAAGAAACRKVLIVDDNQDAARMLAMYVEALGHAVFVEHGARQAMARARDEHPHVCLLDIGLPDIDGHALARHLREQPETAGAVLVAVSGYGQQRDRENSRAAGFDHHFVKPVNAEQLARLLSQPDAPLPVR